MHFLTHHRNFFSGFGDYESDSEIIANAHAMDWQLRDDLLAATKVFRFLNLVLLFPISYNYQGQTAHLRGMRTFFSIKFAF